MRILSTILFAILLAISSFSAIVEKSESVREIDPKNYYIQETTVVEIDGNKVIFETESGNLFSIYGVEDWQVGDRAVLLFDNNGTHEIKDDIIVREFYRG